MKNPNSRKKLYAILITALQVGLFFAALTLLAGVCCHLFGSRKNDVWNLFDVIRVTVGIPAYLLVGYRVPNEFVAILDCMIVNGLLDAFLFGVSLAFWQFIVKGDKENKN
jgi:hypothetical protein